MIKGIHNFSEIGKLQRVLLHRPGREIEALTPSTMERLLFDDVPFLKAAQEEHDAFADLLRKNGSKSYTMKKKQPKPCLHKGSGRILLIG